MPSRRKWDDSWQKFASSSPIPVDGGLATSRARGPIGDSWWSKRFLQILESYGLGGRLERGRRYARTGQIVSLDVSTGLLAAQVQGSRRTPYLVSVTFASPTDQKWNVIDQALSSRIGLAAHLLAGELPPELEEVFTAASVPLFPLRWDGLSARCSCPDWENPCKHIAAVLYLFADRLDADPWLLLEWRGRSQAEVLAALGLASRLLPDDDDLPPWWPLRPGEPLSASTGDRPLSAPSLPPLSAAAVLDRLDELEVTAWKEPAVARLKSIYEVVLGPRSWSADGQSRAVGTKD
jgi:hypothetical protein